MANGVFVTGTDTEIGKTLFAKALVWRWRQDGRRIAVMKPVASGCRTTDTGLRNADAESLLALSNVDAPYETVNPYAFAPAVAPHLAAARAGVRIECSRIRACFDELAAASDCVVVEGVGGWQVPMGPDHTVADVALSLGLPVVLVVGIRLGCLNHALLTAAAISDAGAELAGWAANHIEAKTDLAMENVDALRTRLDAPLWGVIPHMSADPDPAAVNRYLTVPSR
jgi:dethiobiotin synthetase